MKILYVTLIGFLTYSCINQNNKVNKTELIKKDPYEIDSLRIDSIRKELHSRGTEIIYFLSNRYIISGILDTVYSQNYKKVQYFGIWDYKTNKYIDFISDTTIREFFSLPYTVQVQVNDTIIKMTHLGKLPYGDNWEDKVIPVYEQSLKFGKDTIYRIYGKCILKAKEVSKKEYEMVMKRYWELKNKTTEYYPMDDGCAALIIKLFLCSLNGYPDCKDMFFNIEKYLPGSTHGYVREVYDIWLGMYYLYSKENPAPKDTK